jgi:hypothetical protein
MIENDIQRLVSRDSGFDLSSLQKDIWVREALIQGGRAATRRLVSWQALVLVVAIVSSAEAGSTLAISSAKAQSHRTLLDAEGLAPSSLLFGAHP